MGQLKTITRRTFLVGSTAVAGGVAFGTYQYKKELPNPLKDNLQTGEAAITPYVKIDSQGITLITPRADKGQGAYSVQAYLLAEELDVDPHQVRLSPGKPAPIYYNGAVMDEAAPGMGDVIGKLFGMQMTGGSSTVPDMYERLRVAGAVARETIKKAAAIKFGLNVTQLKTEKAHVVLPDGKRHSYVSLAAAVALVEAVKDVELRPKSAWKYLGKPVQRTDMLAKSTGTQIYGIDLHFDNMLYASVRANPALGGGVNSYDDTKAKSMRGVKSILPIKNGVAVIADNTWRAFKALDAIDVQWGSADYPANSEDMWLVLANHIKDEHQDLRRRDEGDVEQVNSIDKIEAIYKTPHLAHAPLEPMNAVVKYTDDRVDIWTGTQIPRFIESHIKEATGFSADQIHLHAQAMGGSFGRRLEDTYVLQALEIAQSYPDTPIKMTWSREEDMSHDYPRPMSMARATGQVKNGQVDSFDLQLVAPSMSASWFGRLAMAPPGPDPTITTGADDQPFAIPNYRVTGYRSPEMVPVSSWRSVGASQNGFYHETFLDELIHAAGADPLHERIRLCNDEVSRTVLRTIGELSDWDKPLAKNMGRGVAFTKAFGVPTAIVVEVTQRPEGIKLERLFVVADVGQVLDPINFEAQAYGGAIFGLGHAMNCELTYENHRPVQTNYHQYEAMRLYQVPEIKVKALENGRVIKGMGEPAVPPSAPALGNAIFAATGLRIRELPFNKHINFV